MKGLPSYDLELKAADERQRLHERVVELKYCLSETLDIRRNTREHLGPICAVTALVGMVTGYAAGGLFARS